MSYDIRLCNSAGETITLDHKHNLSGGTYCLGGTDECWLNVTYNYSAHFRRVFGENGIRTIYGMSGADSAPLLVAGINQLATDVADDYWEATEGNARKALCDLLALALAAPEGIWEGD